MRARLYLVVGGAVCAMASAAHAQPKANSMNVGVCDPKAYANCVKPNADGSINISGSITASNPSVGTNGATAPTSSTQIGIVDGTGKLQPASSTNPVPVTGSFATGYTAAASPTAVSAGTNKPGYIDTANSAQYMEPVKPGTTTAIDLSAPGGVLGVDGATIATTSNPFPTSSQGVTASGSTLTEKPLADGGRAATALPTAVTDGQKVAMMLTKDGKVVMVLNAPESLRVRGSASTATNTATTLIAAQGAGITMEITGAQCFRTDTATTPLYVTLNDSASTTIPVPPATSGAAIVYSTPLLVAANTALTFTPSAAVTTVFCNAQGNQAH